MEWWATMWALVLQVVLYGSYVAVMVFGFFVGAMEIVQTYRMLRFRQVVREKVAECRMTYGDLKHLAALFRQGRAEILHALREAHGATFTGQEADGANRAHILSLIGVHEDEQPFAELPENIGLQLVAIQTDQTSVSQGIPHLAKSLGELYSKNRLELRRQKNFSRLGFLVGVAGLLAALYPFFKSI